MEVSRSQRQARIKEHARNVHRVHMLSKWYDQVPSEYQGFAWDDIIDGAWSGRIKRTTVRKIKEYMENPTKFLLLRGEEGRGKSSMAVTIVSQMVWEYQLSSLYKSVPLLLDEFSFRGSDNPVGACIEPGVLLLDDVGARVEGATDHQNRCMWGVINERYGEEKPTVITTNLPVQSNSHGIGLIDWFGTSSWARIQSSMTVIEFTGETFR